MATLVNKSSGQSSATGTTLAATAFVATAGNFIVVFTALNSLTGTVTGIADTALNTYHQCTGAKKVGAADTCDMWYAYNITGNASNIVTVTFSITHLNRAIAVLQYSGVKSSADPFEIAANASGTTTSLTSASFSPAASGNLNVAGAAGTGGPITWAAGANYTLEQSLFPGVFDIATEDRDGAPSGSQTASISLTVGTSAEIIVVGSFKPPAAAFTPDECLGPNFASQSYDPNITIWQRPNL